MIDPINFTKVYFILYLMKFKYMPLPAQHFTRGRDEVIGKSSIWLKLYLVKLLNISRKVSKRVLQNMNKEKKIWWLMVGGLTTKSQVLSFLHSKSGINCKYLFLGYELHASNDSLHRVGHLQPFRYPEVHTQQKVTPISKFEILDFWYKILVLSIISNVLLYKQLSLLITMSGWLSGC